MLTLSIVIPTKDRPTYVRAAVIAALADLPDGGRVIVVDDHGDKQAIDAVSDLKDARLAVFRNTGARGPSSARNFGVAQADTDLILFADDDDLLKSGYAQHVITLAKTARYGFCATDSFTDEPATIPAFVPVGATDIATAPFRKQLGGLGCGFWIYRDDFNSVGGINPKLRVNEDTDFSIRLLAAGLRGSFETGTGVMIRAHAANTTNLGQITKLSNASARADYFQTIITDNATYLDQHPEAEQYLRRRLVKMHAKAGNLRRGLRACDGSLSLIAYFITNYLIYRVKSN